MGLKSNVIPRSIISECELIYVDIMDPRLSIEMSEGDLVATYDFCTPLDPPWKVKLIFSYNCVENSTTRTIYSATHYVKVSTITLAT